MYKTYQDFLFEQNNATISETEYSEYVAYLDKMSEGNGAVNEIFGLSEKFGKLWSTIVEISTKVGLKIADLVSIFKNKFIFGILKYISFSFQRLFDFIKDGYKAFVKFRDALAQYIAKHPLVKKSSEYAAWFDGFLAKYPVLKIMSGVLLAYMLFYIWTTVISFTGDPEFDFNVADMWDSLIGKKGFADIFGNDNGIKMLTFIVTNKTLGLTFPWPGSTSIQFIFAVIYTLGIAVGKKIKKQKV